MIDAKKALLAAAGITILTIGPMSHQAYAAETTASTVSLQSHLPDGVFYPESFSLDNGLKVIVIPMHRAPVVNHMIWYRVGAADDPRGKSGLAHFLEHLMFKGTHAVPDGQFSEIVARLGGEENAFTAHDTTSFYQSMAKEHLGRMMEMEADRMTNLTLGEKEVLSERDVIIAERHQTIDQKPYRRLGEMMDASLFAGTPYSTPVIGWEKDMAGLSRADALAFYHQWYAPNNATLIVSGDVTMQDVRTLAEQYYGPIPSRPVPDHIRHDNPPQKVDVTMTLHDDQVHDPALIRSFIGPDSIDRPGPDYYALQVLQDILGGGKSSWLYRQLVLDQRIATDVSFSVNDAMTDMTEIGYYAQPAPGIALPKLEQALNQSIDRFLDKGISDQDLFAAKERILAAAILARDSLDTPPRVFGFSISHGQSIDDIEQWPKRIAAITRDQVMDLARRLLRPDHQVTGYMLPPAMSAKSASHPAHAKGKH